VKIVRGIRELRLDGDVGLVPTMGGLHAGHLALFRAARDENELVVASLFVNPAQFGDPDDLAAYPRDERRDAALASDAGVDVLFAPSVEELYRPGFGTWVDVEDTGAEGAARPGHFRGVATVCLKLFNIVRPRRAYFGQKDAQQVAVVHRMVRDLDLDLRIRVVPTVRDDDGLAFSSRNSRLNADERQRALGIPRALHAAAASADPVAVAKAELNGLDPDYVELVELEGATVLATAVRIGSTRLIDNVLVKGALS
jgi:pantoate--beta-alanine ligase